VPEFCYSFEIRVRVVVRLKNTLQMKGASIPEIYSERTNYINHCSAKKITNMSKYIGWNYGNKYLSDKLKNCTF
jgi:hypothetical protein